MRFAATSRYTSSAPWAMPMADVETERTKTCPKGSLKSGAVFCACPGLFRRNPSMSLCVRCSGTKASSTTMSLLPVAARPSVNHVSSMR